MLGFAHTCALRAMLVGVAIDDEQEQIDHRIGVDAVAHHRSIERLVHTAQARIPEHVDAHRQPQVGEQALRHRLQNVLIEHRIHWDDEDLHSAISSQPVANSSSIPVRSSVSSKRGRSPRRRMIVPSCSATRPNTTAESSVSRGTACSIIGE